MDFKLICSQKMNWIKNDLNIKKQANILGVSFWQTPGFLFLMLGIVIIVVMTAVFVVSRESINLQQLVIAEFLVVALILSVGNILIVNMEKLARAHKSKSEFISIISHQLKTPITGIAWDMELLFSKHKEGLSKKQLEILDNVNLSNRVISRMVSDLLDVSRIDRNDLFTKREEIDIVEIMERVLSKNEILGRENKIKIKFWVDDNMPKIMGDKKKTEVVLDNLVSNAIKYNKEGGSVLINARKDGKKAVISVRDTGIGIPKEDGEMVFDKFFRSENASTKDVSGTGLGLYITKNIVEKSGGRLWFHSNEGEGTVFFVSLPLA